MISNCLYLYTYLSVYSLNNNNNNIESDLYFNIPYLPEYKSHLSIRRTPKSWGIKMILIFAGV